MALGNYADPRYREALEKLLQTDPDTQVPEYAIQALAKIGDRRSAKVIAPFLKHKIYTVQHEAILALGRLQAHEYIDELLPFLRESDASRGWYRSPLLAAIEALGLMGDPSYIGALQPFLQHREDVVRITARTAISRLDGTLPKPPR
jgi:HEAT repeat protein